MKKELFADLQEALSDARRFARGEAIDLGTALLPAPPRTMSAKQIRSWRRQLEMSQVAFARALNVSLGSVRSWEQGTRKPSGAALKLLRAVEKDPRILAA